jgi:hypothetical protein
VIRQRRVPLARRRRALFAVQVLGLAGLVAVTGTASGRSTKKSVKSATAKAKAAPSTTKAATGSTKAKVTALGVYQAGLRNGWNDYGWSTTRELGAGSARIDMGNWQGWLLDRNATPVEGSRVVIRYRTATDLGEFLQIGLTAVGQSDVVTEVPIAPTAPAADGFRTATVDVAQFSPSLGFFQIRLRPTRALPAGTIVEFASIEVVSPAAAVAAPSVGSVKTAGKATISIDCQAPGRKPIDARIYGIGYSGASYLKADTSKLGATINRWGGNPTSRYNWKLGNVWNTALDYFWRNVTIADGTNNALETFFAKNAEANRLNAVTVPMLGWVAKDVSSYSFSVKAFGAQQATDPGNADIGNGRSADGKKLAPPDPKTTSVAIGPDDIRQWVASSLKGRTNMYFLDNELELWNDTHRDVHPAATTYDEVLDLGVRYATAIKAADPSAIVAGPASWGWPAYFYSALDAENGFSGGPDRKAHGDTPLLAWYLQEMKKQETKSGRRLLDVLDVHFYPQQSNVYGGGVGGLDAATAKLRLRSTRALWDPSYADESWIGEPVNLLPRMQKLIAENYPGTGLSIGEWSFGGEGHMSGGLATAIALGRFGTEGVTAAYYWTAPPANSPTFWAFRAFRNYDGKGGRFLDVSVPARSSNDAVSVFASTNEATSELVTVIVNTDPTKAFDAPITGQNCRPLTAVQTFTFDGAPTGFRGPTPVDPARVVVPAYSVTVVKASLR